MDKGKIGDIKGSEMVKDSEGRQYHIGLAPGEMAENIILVGDPDRPDKAKEFFSEILFEKQSREFKTITGKVDDLTVSVMSTGIGSDNIEICLVEIMQICKSPTIIRAGSCGGLQEFLNLGDLVISTGAVRLENTSSYFVPEGFPAVANYEVVEALIESAEELNVPYHTGLTASASGFYGAQGRKIPGLPLRFPNLLDNLVEANVYNFEMEASTLFIMSQIFGYRAGVICAVYANRPKGTFIDNVTKKKSEKNCLQTAINALSVLHRMEYTKDKYSKSRWHPSLGLK
ncbi:MAG: nucleoside phosphorylase [Candidatus Hodarchaeales archaeon]